MTPPPPRVPRSRRRVLSERSILDVAQRVLQREGLEAVTMRRVADDLGTGPASLYVHISGRDELLAALLERVMKEVPLVTPEPGRWREQAHALLEGVRAVLRAHAGLAVVAAGQASDETSLAIVENLLAILHAGGLTGRQAAWTADGLFLIAVAGALDARPDDTAADVADESSDAAFMALPPDRFPLLTRLSEELAPRGAEERFRFAVETLLDGVSARTGDSLGRLHASQHGEETPRDGRTPTR